MTIKEVTQFFHDVQVELSKVQWPKFNEFVGATTVVLFLVLLFMIYLWLLDFGLSKLAQYIFSFYRGGI